MVFVSVLECKNYENVGEIVSKSLDKIGCASILKKGIKVLIKPNILATMEPEKAVTTHPAVIDAVCEYLKKYDVRIYIGESSGTGAMHGTEKAFEASGIKKVSEKHEVEFINFDNDEHIIIENPNAVKMKKIVMSKRLREMDLILDACKLKTHMFTGYTGAVKNLFGILPGRSKVNAHNMGRKLKDFNNILLDIYTEIKPQICLMDAVVGMEGNGPSNGDPKKTGLIIASRNGIALDYVASKIIGYKPDKLGLFKIARKRGIMPNVEVLGLKNISIPYKKPLSFRFGYYRYIQNFVMRNIQASFCVDKEKCVKCGNCVIACPQKAINMENGFPEWDKRKCIMCYCCHELCPQGAVKLKKSLMGKLADKIKKRFDD